LVAAHLPPRQLRVLGEGGSAPQDYLRQFPATVHVVGRRRLTGKLDERPPPLAKPRRGWPPKKGPLLGSPQTLARKRAGWQPPPPEASTLVQAWAGLGHPVLPGRVLRVGGVRRPPPPRARKPGQRKPLPAVEALFTTDLTRSVAALLAQSGKRGAVELLLRDSKAFTGFGQDQCRKSTRVGGAPTFRLLLAATRTLGCVEQASRTAALDLTRFRPWSRHPQAPSQLDLVWACREALQEAGVFPIPRGTPGLAKIQQEPENALPLAA
jgi:hypothetical protein